MLIAKCYPALYFDIKWTTLYSMTVSGWHVPLLSVLCHVPLHKQYCKTKYIMY